MLNHLPIWAVLKKRFCVVDPSLAFYTYIHKNAYILLIHTTLIFTKFFFSFNCDADFRYILHIMENHGKYPLCGVYVYAVLIPKTHSFSCNQNQCEIYLICLPISLFIRVCMVLLHSIVHVVCACVFCDMLHLLSLLKLLNINSHTCTKAHWCLWVDIVYLLTGRYICDPHNGKNSIYSLYRGTEISTYTRITHRQFFSFYLYLSLRSISLFLSAKWKFDMFYCWNCIKYIVKWHASCSYVYACDFQFTKCVFGIVAACSHIRS